MEAPALPCTHFNRPYCQIVAHQGLPRAPKGIWYRPIMGALEVLCPQSHFQVEADGLSWPQQHQGGCGQVGPLSVPVGMPPGCGLSSWAKTNTPLRLPEGFR